MAFSLSPAVSVREINVAQNVPNIPSTRTGAVIRADYGPCQTPTGVTNEAELVAMFGRPTALNFQDWFQAWNFLQYASSLYLSRPIPRTSTNTNYKNAGITISDNTASETNAELYNSNKAETELQTITVGGKLALFNRYVVPTQKLAIGVCSNGAYWNQPIANAYTSEVSFSALASGSSIPLLSNSLVKGSKFLSPGTGKLFNVLSTTPSSVTVDYTFTTADEAKKELSLGFITFTSSTSGALGAVSLASVSNNAKVGQTFLIGATLAYVTAVTATTVSLVTADASTIQPAASTIYANAESFWMTLASSATIPAGSKSFSVSSGFNINEGHVFVISNTTGFTTSPTDAQIESGNSYTVISTDPVNNIIYIDSPLVSAVNKINNVAFSGAPSTLVYVDIDPVITLLKGINLLSEKFDSSLIKKTRLTAIFAVDGITGVAKPFVKEELLYFSDMLEFEPTWANGEFLTVVLEKDSSNIYLLVEKLVSSYTSDARNTDGRNIFADNIFFTGSKYLFAKVGTGLQVNSSLATGLTDGLFTFNPTTGTSAETDYVFTDFNQASVQFAFEEFADPESFDINILIAHQLDMNYASTIAESRKDCVAVVAPYDANELITKSASEATQVLLEKYGSRTVYDNKVFNTFGTYTGIYGNMKYQYDKFNDVNRWIGVLGDVAGLYSQTDSNRDPWWAVAGSERGIIKNVIKLAVNFNKQNRDDLYVNAINPIISVVGEGAGVVYGQKTATSISSSFDRMNVRRLLIFLEKSIATSAKTGLFEFNDAFTRQRLFSMIEPFLRTVKARRGLYDYKLVIDDTNNNAEVIDANGLVIDIYLKPTKVAEFIQVSAIVVKTGTSFTEVVGKV